MEPLNKERVCYICDGMMPKCSGKLGCFKYGGVPFDDEAICFHTLDGTHAVNGPVDDPEDPNVAWRFSKIDTKTGPIYWEDKACHPHAKDGFERWMLAVMDEHKTPND